jgi:sigma-E factor negative regulatory protein RseC
MPDIYKHEAIVTKILPNNKMIVEVARTSACSSCSLKGGCGVSSESPNNSYKVDNDINAKIGDSIIISIEQKTLYKSAFLVYILPIILMLLTSYIIQLIFKKDIYTAISSLITLSIYFIILKILMGKKKSELKVSIIK